MRQLLLVLATLTVVLAAACAGEPAAPAPTATLPPTPTPTPTSTPTPTATPTPAAAPAFEVSADTLGRSIVERLTDAETECIREQLGDQAFEDLLDSPVVGGVAGDATIPYECLGRETGAALAVAVISAQAGGMRTESEDCLRRLFLSGESGAFDFFATQQNNDADSIVFVLNFLLCLTDEEAEALAEQPGGFEAFRPSALRCATEHVSVEELAGLFETADGAPPAISPELIQVLAGCGFSDAPDDAPPEDTLTLEQLRAVAQVNPSIQPLVDCLEERSTPEAIAEFFAGQALVPPAGVIGCMADYGHLLNEAFPPGGE